ncbi:MAG: hypothetical protein ACJ75M_18695, partial [Actinomycetes bacterium]
MLATITRPWIGRRCGALAGPNRAACSSSSSGGWTSSNAQWGERPRPWFPSRRDPDDRAAGAHPNPNLTGTLRGLGGRPGGPPGVGRAVSVRNACKLKSTGFHLDPLARGPDGFLRILNGAHPDT